MKRVTIETSKIPSRAAMLQNIEQKDEFDLLVIGGGATGSGVALDAALRGLKVVCVEREDFASGTSSRSTKLLWGGSRYLVGALVSLFNQDLRLIRRPIDTIQRFRAEFKMVLNCHRERRYMLNQQSHLTNWLPIAVPITKWVLWPPPFNYPLAALGPLGMFPVFFKFYDALSGWTCPPSHTMSKSRALRKFPQLNVENLKYCSVFYEGQHNDARTNLAVALTASKFGATMLNYMTLSKLHFSSEGVATGGQVTDSITGKSYDIKAKSVVFCGGPFTDELRKIENPACENVVKGASGIHIVVPGYYAPKGFGLVDMSTSDGRFLFYLPWENHVLIGTTDRPAEPSMRPTPSEKEIQWLLRESSKYLSKEVKVRREDVLSSWCGVRPLASDPSSESTASMSRDHVISLNKTSKIIFVAGGKWTTFREMAEDCVDKVLDTFPSLKKEVQPCSTLTVPFVGRDGYSINLPIKLVQEYDIPQNVADRLTKAYGGRASDVIEIAQNELGGIKYLASGYPFIEAEVVFAARHEWAVRAQDVLARRTSLAFLNKREATKSIDKIVQLMAKELKWSDKRVKEEKQDCLNFLSSFGGPEPVPSHEN